MNETVFESRTERETKDIALEFARQVRPGTVVGLVGTLGSGKTRFVQGMAEAYGIDPQWVVSPTYTICHEHDGTTSLVHIDCYRLNDDDEFLELDVDEYLARPAIVVIEWADRFRHLLPRKFIEVQIEESETGRRIRVREVSDDD